MRNQHIKQLDRALFTGALSVSKDKGWTACSKLALGGKKKRKKKRRKNYKISQEIRSRTGKLFTQTGNETINLSFKKLYINSKCSGPYHNTRWPAQAVGLELHERNNSSLPPVGGFCCLNHCVNSSGALW